MGSQIVKFDLYNDGVERDVYFFKGSTFDLSNNKIIIINHDAQFFHEPEHTWDGKSWRISEVLNSLGITNVLVVGLACKKDIVKRGQEYSPFPFTDKIVEHFDMKKDSFKGQLYHKALIERFIPWTEKEFSYEFKTAQKLMIGASMGGVITTYFAKENPKLFDTYLSFSTAFWVNDPWIFEHLFKNNTLGRYYHDMGGQDETYNKKKVLVGTKTDYIHGYEIMKKYLEENNIESKSVFVEKHGHDELCWHERVAEALKWALKLG